MKKYIIIPANQTEGMEGYSAIAIEVTPSNIKDIERMFKVLDDVRQLDATISRISYDNPMVDIILLNDNFNSIVDIIHIENISNELMDEFIEESEFKVNAPALEVSNYGVKIFYDAEYSDSQVYCEFTQEELTEVLTQVE